MSIENKKQLQQQLNALSWTKNDNVYNEEEINDIKKIIKRDKKMESKNKNIVSDSNRTIEHAAAPESSIRLLINKTLDINGDGVVDATDFKFVLKFIAKYLLLVASIVYALMEKMENDDGMLFINPYNIAGWTTIISVVVTIAYQKYRNKLDSESYINMILKYKDLILLFIDFLNRLIHAKATDDIMAMTQNFLIKVKDGLARNEIDKNEGLLDELAKATDSNQDNKGLTLENPIVVENPINVGHPKSKVVVVDGVVIQPNKVE